MLRFLLIPIGLYLALVALVYFRQRSLLFFPTHRAVGAGGLKPWTDGGRTIGYCREITNAQTIWLMTHGNGGQAADRDYLLPCLSENDSLYVLEYPGYGAREGTPSRESIGRAAAEAYENLRRRFPTTPVCVLGESIGTGPASALAGEKLPPDKIVLVVPYDSLVKVAAKKFWFLPVRLLLRDNWDNVEALRHYSGPLEIYGATCDEIIPFSHAQALAQQLPRAKFVPLNCGHNVWAEQGQVKIRRTEQD